MQEDFITQNWDSGERLPYMDERPKPVHNQGHFDPNYERVLQENRQTKESIYKEKEAFELKMFIESLNRLVQTEDGYRVFRQLCKDLGFKDSILAMDASGPNTKAMLFNESRRHVWMDLRKKLSIQNRNRIEEDV